jgi:hypothetical protein
MSTTISQIIAVPAERALGYAEALLKDIPAERFAHMPHPTMNHPAFNIGHLAGYPDRVFAMVGRPELAKRREDWDKLFAAGAPCVEQDGRYPAKQEIVERFIERSRAAIDALASVPDEVHGRQNPAEGRFREMLPTIGIAVNFLLNSHVMMHLGQISSWRRAVGLPSAM